MNGASEKGKDSPVVVAIACLVCGSRSYSSVLVHAHYQIARCQSCGFVFVNPRPSEESLLNLYVNRSANPYFASEYEPPEYELPVLSKVIRVIKSRINCGTLLEVGCGRGDFVELAQANGFTVTGCDVFGGEIPNIKNAEFYDGPLRDAQFPAQHFDVVVARNTFEHLFDANVELNEIRRVLKDNGYLYLKVPNVLFEHGLCCRLFFGKRHKFSPPYHLNHFSANSLRALLKKAGFKFTAWYLEQPTGTRSWRANIVRHAGHRLFQSVYLASGRGYPFHPTLSCLSQKTAQ